MKDWMPFDLEMLSRVKNLPAKDNRVDFKEFYESKEAFYNLTSNLPGFKEDKKRMQLLENG